MKYHCERICDSSHKESIQPFLKLKNYWYETHRPFGFDRFNFNPCLPLLRSVSWKKRNRYIIEKIKEMNKLLRFGENVKGYDIRVLNEREIRAAAGILFLATFISLMLVIFKNNFLPIKYVISFFLLDFIVRVFVNPKFSPTLIIGRLIVRNQAPEYVGAQQKKFAWIIGVALSATMFVFIVVVNSYSAITGIICYTCLSFLFFESAFGICLGCKFYSLFYKQKAEYCPGEVCNAKSRHDIQKTSWVQLLIVFVFVAFIFLATWVLNDRFSKKPHDLFGINGIQSQLWIYYKRTRHSHAMN